jgi:hypothetical protein
MSVQITRAEIGSPGRASHCPHSGCVIERQAGTLDNGRFLGRLKDVSGVVMTPQLVDADAPKCLC